MTTISFVIAHEVYSHHRAWHEWHLEQEAIAELPHQSHDRLAMRLYPWWHHLLREYVDFTPYSRSMTYTCFGSSRSLPISIDAILQLRFLRALNLHDCEITDAGAQRIMQLEDLEVLVIEGDPISDSGLVGIENKRQLVTVGLSGTSIADATISRLATIQSLENVYISNTRVSDSCVPDLVSIPRLRELDIRQTAITKIGALNLTKRCETLQRLIISSDQIPIDEEPKDGKIQIGPLAIIVYD